MTETVGSIIYSLHSAKLGLVEGNRLRTLLENAANMLAEQAKELEAVGAGGVQKPPLCGRSALNLPPVRANSPDITKVRDVALRAFGTKSTTASQQEAHTNCLIDALYENGDPVSIDAAEEMKRLSKQVAAPSIGADDEALIRQLLEAIEKSSPYLDCTKPLESESLNIRSKAIAAARARLGEGGAA